MARWSDFFCRDMFGFAPFLIAFGAACYFIMPDEPFVLWALGALLIPLVFIRRIPIPMRAIILFIFGFSYACGFANIIDTPQLTHDLHNQKITAIVSEIDYTPDAVRVYMDVPSEQIYASGDTARVRINLPQDSHLPNIGDTISANVGLFRPSPASAPATFDWARYAYFNNLTATGYATDFQITDVNNRKNWRDFIHRQTNSFLVDSLVLGYKNVINKSESEIWTAVGVGHVWSISGFHITLVGGWLFAIFYMIFRSIPYITRRIPAKIPALICAWVGLLGYLFLSGCDVATLRAFMMTTLIFAAFIFGRSALSMRNVALAFCFMFLINPHYVMQAGFQLSFAAVYGLIWLYSVVKPKMPRNKLLKIIYVAILTSLCATIFTAPFVAAHFGHFPVYGLIGNLVLLPVFSVAIMPLVMIGTITALIGWDMPLILADKCYEITLNIAEHIANWPAAIISVPHITNASMVIFIIGFICLILSHHKINVIVWGACMTLGILSVLHTPKPVFLVTPDNELIAIVDDNGKLQFNKGRSSKHFWVFNTWKAINGEPQDTPNVRIKHDHGLYRYKNIAYMQKFVPLMNNLPKLCADDSIDYIVSWWKIDAPNCAHKIKRGGFVMYKNGFIHRSATNRLWN